VDRIPASLSGAALDPIELALVEVDAAITLVARGVAVTITVSGLPLAEDVAATAAARAQAEGLAFHVRRGARQSVTLVVGPRLAAAPVDLGS
jgi:antitoxin (DNA-binding transcriptional repressor) of toxin-antitoxin stability system